MFGDSNVIYFSLLGNESRVSDSTVSNQRESELVDAKDLSAKDDFKLHSLAVFSEPQPVSGVALAFYCSSSQHTEKDISLSVSEQTS